MEGLIVSNVLLWVLLVAVAFVVMGLVRQIGVLHGRLAPADGKDYIISYNDCCGKQSCAQCACTRNDSEEPAYRPFNNNDVNWCLAAKSHIYHCTVSIIRGVAV